jgi:hypothetical protein
MPSHDQEILSQEVSSIVRSFSDDCDEESGCAPEEQLLLPQPAKWKATKGFIWIEVGR